MPPAQRFINPSFKRGEANFNLSNSGLEDHLDFLVGKIAVAFISCLKPSSPQLNPS
jgi:hypothetical protein